MIRRPSFDMCIFVSSRLSQAYRFFRECLRSRGKVRHLRGLGATRTPPRRGRPTLSSAPEALRNRGGLPGELLLGVGRPWRPPVPKPAKSSAPSERGVRPGSESRSSPLRRTRRVLLYAHATNWPGIAPPRRPAFAPPLTAGSDAGGSGWPPSTGLTMSSQDFPIIRQSGSTNCCLAIGSRPDKPKQPQLGVRH